MYVCFFCSFQNWIFAACRHLHYIIYLLSLCFTVKLTGIYVFPWFRFSSIYQNTMFADLCFVDLPDHYKYMYSSIPHFLELFLYPSGRTSSATHVVTGSHFVVSGLVGEPSSGSIVYPFFDEAHTGDQNQVSWSLDLSFHYWKIKNQLSL